MRRLGSVVGAMAGLAVAGFAGNVLGVETVDGWDLRYAGSALSAVNVSYSQNGVNYTTISCGAGLLKFDPAGDTYTTGGQTFPVTGTAFWTFCTDVGVWLHTSNGDDEGNGWDYVPGSFTGNDGVNPTWRAGGAYDAAYIYNKLVQGYASLNAGPAQQQIWGNVSFGALNAADEYAAAQIAIWETLYDSDSNLGTGRFKLNTTGAINDKAQEILNQLAADRSAGDFTVFDTTWLKPINDDGTEGGSQGLLYPPVPFSALEVLPEVPDGGTTLALLGIATVAMGLFGRRIRRE